MNLNKILLKILFLSGVISCWIWRTKYLLYQYSVI